MHPTPMKIGIHVPQLGRLADPAAVRAAAVAAERVGYSSLWVLDRVLSPVEPRSPYPGKEDGRLPAEQGVVLDPIGTLILAAAVTERIRVGTSVLVAPWYPPVLLARSLTTLDLISGGRLDVGLGIGWSLDEYEAVGVPQRELAARLEETLDVLDAVWGDDPVEHRGERIRITPSVILPKPAQRPRPPILLAAYTPAGLERVARRADGWNPAGLPVELLAPMWATVRDQAAALGRDPESLKLVVRANLTLTDRPLGADRPSYHGSVEQIVDDLEATRRVGAQEVILGPSGDHRLDELLDIYARLAETYDAAA